MRITRSWLNEFINLDGISNDALCATFNSIGLEVDSIKEYRIPDKVVVGKILSCIKHQDADKLNVAHIDVGGTTLQIVCGAANVVMAEYVVVALVGAVLPGNFEIKDAKLRGIESTGMVCSASELGLPSMGDGIMILDESIGKLEVGRPLSDYERFNDTVIEIELTANRGDCLSINGIARDLGAALERELRASPYTATQKEKLGVARLAEIQSKGENEANLRFLIAQVNGMVTPFLVRLRLAMVEIEQKSNIDNLINYTIHATGVILRAYDAGSLKDDAGRIRLQILCDAPALVNVTARQNTISMVGLSQEDGTKAKEGNELLLIEASYIRPEALVEVASASDVKRDELYYKTSRGSEPNLEFGLEYVSLLLEQTSSCKFYEGHLTISSAWEASRISADTHEICSIIGQDIPKSKIVTILSSLGFGVQSGSDGKFVVIVPRFRHDIKNIQDITEEIVRIVGINNIESKPLAFVEKNRHNAALQRHNFKKTLRHQLCAVGFNESISYIFADGVKQKEYGFDSVSGILDLANPIAEDLSTPRTTILVNLLEAAKRNVSYTERSIGLFEVGAVFDRTRQQSMRVSMLLSGQDEGESVLNSGKPKKVDFGSFVKRIQLVLGDFKMVACTYHNELIHPYQSANLLYREKLCGFITKLHPKIQEEYGLGDTFLAELEFDLLMPEHINASAISKYQGVYKDLSIVIDKTRRYREVDNALGELKIELLKRWYAIDIYEDEQLGEKKSLTVRFFIQSHEKTLQDSDIEEVMTQVMGQLQERCEARLR